MPISLGSFADSRFHSLPKLLTSRDNSIEIMPLFVLIDNQASTMTRPLPSQQQLQHTTTIFKVTNNWHKVMCEQVQWTKCSHWNTDMLSLDGYWVNCQPNPMPVSCMGVWNRSWLCHKPFLGITNGAPNLIPHEGTNVGLNSDLSISIMYTCTSCELGNWEYEGQPETLPHPRTTCMGILSVQCNWDIVQFGSLCKLQLWLVFSSLISMLSVLFSFFFCAGCSCHISVFESHSLCQIFPVNKLPFCQDWFFADLIFRGVRGSGHGLAVRLKGYVV